jgi:arginine:pyruvate transaminase
MFALVKVSSTGMSGYDYAKHLLHNGGVAVMPGSSFGDSLNDWVRIALTTDDAPFTEACTRMIAHSKKL